MEPGQQRREYRCRRGGRYSKLTDIKFHIVDMVWPTRSRLFAKNGYRIALVARNAEHLKNAAAEITKEGGEVSRSVPNKRFHEVTNSNRLPRSRSTHTLIPTLQICSKLFGNTNGPRRRRRKFELHCGTQVMVFGRTSSISQRKM